MYASGHADRAVGQSPCELRGQRVTEIASGRRVPGNRECRGHRRQIEQHDIGVEQTDHDRQRRPRIRLGRAKIGHRGRPQQRIVRIHRPRPGDLRRLGRREPYRHPLVRQDHGPGFDARRARLGHRAGRAIERLGRTQVPGQRGHPASIPPPRDERRRECPPGRHHLLPQPSEQPSQARPSGQHPHQHQDQHRKFEQCQPGDAPVAAPEVRAERIRRRCAADRALPRNR